MRFTFAAAKTKTSSLKLLGREGAKVAASVMSHKRSQ